MPVVVVNSYDNFYRIDIDGDAAARPISSLFQLEVDYAYRAHGDSARQVREYFLLDMVSLDELEGYLKVLGSDRHAIASIWNLR